MHLPWLDPDFPVFPDTSQALNEPNGLLAAGGQLTKDWLIAAYQKGIFPWFNEGDPILWWTPSPRMVLYLSQLHISRTLRKALRKQDFRVTINQSFESVISHCATPRPSDLKEPGTWITTNMTNAYIELHQLGYAHSVEVWRGDILIGGLYGIALGKVFFGESMFSQATNGSKIAISYLVEWLKQWQYGLIDCQVYNDHLSRLGAAEVDRDTFEQTINRHMGTINLAEPFLTSEEWTSQDISELITW